MANTSVGTKMGAASYAYHDFLDLLTDPATPGGAHGADS
jgi:hypothetical protein